MRDHRSALFEHMYVFGTALNPKAMRPSPSDAMAVRSLAGRGCCVWKCVRANVYGKEMKESVHARTLQ